MRVFFIQTLLFVTLGNISFDDLSMLSFRSLDWLHVYRLIDGYFFAPIAVALGFDPIAFAIIDEILAIETGLLTPLLGILVFTDKVAITD